MIPLAVNMYVELAKVSPVVVLICEVHSKKRMTMNITLPDEARPYAAPVINWFSDGNNIDDKDYGNMKEVNMIVTFTSRMGSRSKLATTYHSSKAVH